MVGLQLTAFNFTSWLQSFGVICTHTQLLMTSITLPIHAQSLFLEGLNPYFIIQIGNIFS